MGWISHRTPYECYKVDRGRTYAALYTKDIAVSDGSYKFTGLPGLIKYMMIKIISITSFYKSSINLFTI